MSCWDPVKYFLVALGCQVEIIHTFVICSPGLFVKTFAERLQRVEARELQRQEWQTGRFTQEIRNLNNSGFYKFHVKDQFGSSLMILFPPRAEFWFELPLKDLYFAMVEGWFKELPFRSAPLELWRDTTLPEVANAIHDKIWSRTEQE